MLTRAQPLSSDQFHIADLSLADWAARKSTSPKAKCLR